MQQFGYSIKRSLRSIEGIFWALVFPLFLGLIFKFMFGNLGTYEQFSEVAVGVVEQTENDVFVEMLKEIEMEEDLHMFEVFEYENVDEAEKALQNETVYTYIVVDGDEFTLMIRKMDIYTSLVKSFVDQYKQNYTLIEEVAKKDPKQAVAFATNLFDSDSIGLEEIELKGQDKSPYTQYFYALLGMACLIASMYGLGHGMDLQADMTTIGARRNVAPTPKMQQFVTDFLASMTMYSVLMTIVLVAVVYVYGQDFGDNFGLVWLVTIVGTFTGLAGGYLIATWVKGPKGKKEAMCIAFFMVSSFLGGLQMAEMPYILEEKCPIINRINPATLLVNAYKSLAVFGDYQQYAVNVISLLVIGVLFMIFSVAKLRRTKYASI
ncbi:MAG: ABC transporter permease [Lachnospiraceae bacterium]|nr:ABC transporter permease [Lachnospiraceae bacterium]